MEGLIPLIIQLASGVAGGNLAASLMKNLSLGTIGNSIAGIVGGGLGGQILAVLGMDFSSGGMDVASIIGSIAGGGVGGGLMLAIVGAIKKAMAKK